MDFPFVRQLSPHSDSRGVSVRLFDVDDLRPLNLNNAYILSVTNTQSGTIRGMHMQINELAEWKLLTVTAGSIFDVVIDLRPESGSYGMAYTCSLSALEPSVLSIPKGFAHGYQTLSPNTTLLYALDGQYSPNSTSIFNPLCDQVSVIWPLPVGCLSEADRTGASLPFSNMSFLNLPELKSDGPA